MDLFLFALVLLGWVCWSKCLKVTAWHEGSVWLNDSHIPLAYWLHSSQVIPDVASEQCYTALQVRLSWQLHWFKLHKSRSRHVTKLCKLVYPWESISEIQSIKERQGAAFIPSSTGTQVSSLPVQTILIDSACWMSLCTWAIYSVCPANIQYEKAECHLNMLLTSCSMLSVKSAASVMMRNTDCFGETRLVLLIMSW